MRPFRLFDRVHILGVEVAASLVAIGGVFFGSVTANAAPGNQADILTPQAVLIDTRQPGSDPIMDVVGLEMDAPMTQVTSVSQLTDVQPTDWAFQALQSLVERYGCLVGYPNQTFRGHRALGRYEFAAGVNACLDRVNELLQTATADFSQTDDRLVLQRLQEEFAAELATLRGRLDALETRTATLETQQFSTTTKLFGQAIIGVQGRTSSRADFLNTQVPGFEGIPLLGQDGRLETRDAASQVTLGYNVQLSLLTQFSPRSMLLTGLRAGNLTTTDRSLFGFTNSFTRLGYEVDTENQIQLSDLTFRHLVANNLAVIVGTEGVNPVNVFRGPSRVESEGYGPLSRFAQRNPILQLGAGRTGVGFDWQIARRVSLQGVYAASLADRPWAGQGLFNGGYVAGAQLFLTPLDSVDIALYYLHSYSGSLGGFLGTGVGDDQVSALPGSRLSTHAYGATVNWQLSKSVGVSGWVGFTDSHLVSHAGRVKTMNWMTTLQFPDLFGKGNLGAIAVGQPPRITDSHLRDNGVLAGNIPSFFEGSLGTRSGGREGHTYHLEAFYRWRISDHITVTPGVIVLFNPAHNSANETVTIGAIRTTFAF